MAFVLFLGFLGLTGGSRWDAGMQRRLVRPSGSAVCRGFASHFEFLRREFDGALAGEVVD